MTGGPIAALVHLSKQASIQMQDHPTKVTWDSPLEVAPTAEHDSLDQATYVADIVRDYYFPEPPDPAAFRQFCAAVDYPWQPVRFELLKSGIELPRRKRPRLSSGPTGTNVPIVPSNTSAGEGAIGTQLNHWIGLRALIEDAEEEYGVFPETCVRGIGALLSLDGYEERGRDIQLPCKVKTCAVCGPKKRKRKVSQIMKNFGGGDIHAVLVADGDEWEAFHKTYLDRDDANYHRIPAPERMSIILTDAEVGEVIDEQDVEVVVELQPCDGRRMTHSREWKADKPERRWSRVGISPLNTADRTRVYEEEGCHPVGAPAADGLISAHDVALPAADSPAMEKLKERLHIRAEENGKLGEDGWPV